MKDRVVAVASTPSGQDQRFTTHTGVSTNFFGPRIPSVSSRTLLAMRSFSTRSVP
jgi:hypothetical protein